MSGFRYSSPYQTALDAAGVTIPGALLYFYQSGTSTPLATYSNAALSLPNTNPVVSDAGGLFPSIFLLSARDYKVILKDSNGNQLWQADPVNGGGVTVAIETVTNISALRALSVTSAALGSIIYVRGYYTDNDGGEGYFLCTDQNPGADNGGTIVWSSTAGFYFLRDTQGAPYSIAWFGAVGDNSTDNSTFITNTINALNAIGGGTMYVPGKTYADSNTTRTLYPRINILGCAMGCSVIRSTATSGVQFNMPSANETSVEYGGNVISNISFVGAGTGTTCSCFKIKNKVNILFDHVEIDNYQYLVLGVRDNVANSVNNISFTSCRFLRCQTAIYAGIAWNGLYIDRATQFASFLDWGVIIYDSAGITVEGVFDANPSNSGAGHLFLGGCSGFLISTYHEGNPNVGYMVGVASGKAADGSATVNGIAISNSRGGSMCGTFGASAGGTPYVLKLDGVLDVACVGCRAGSGISTAFAYLTTNTRANSFIGCYPAAGTVVVFQTAVDSQFNLVQDFATGVLSLPADTWLPVVTGVASAGTCTYVIQTGNWTRAYNRIFFDIQVQWTGHTGTGAIRVSLPFPVIQFAAFAVRSDGLAAGSITAIQSYAPPDASSTLRVETYATGTANDLSLAATGHLLISGNYIG